jgi:type I restriction enzyme, S subunit
MKTARLGDIARVVRGVSFPSGEAHPIPHADSVPVLRAGNIAEELDLCSDLVYVKSAYVSKDQYLCQNDIVICTSSGSSSVVGKTAMLRSGWQGSIGAFNSVIRARADVSPTYLFHYLRSAGFRNWTRQSSGANIKNIRKSELEDHPIPLPPLEEQKRIAAILDKADRLRSLREQAIAKLDELAQSIFLEMFGDPVTNPKGWERVALGDLIKFMTSGSRGWAKYYSGSGAWFLRIQNVRGGQVIKDRIQHVVAPNTKEATRTRVEADDLLISITADLGRTAVVDDETAAHGSHINQHLCLVRLAECNPHYVAAFLESAGGKAQFGRLDQVGVKSGLDFASIRSLSIPLPPREMQDEYGDLLRDQRRLVGRQQSGLDTMATLQNRLSSQAFSGDLSA